MTRRFFLAVAAFAIASTLEAAGRIPPPQVEWVPGHLVLKVSPGGTATASKSEQDAPSMVATIQSASGMEAERLFEISAPLHKASDSDERPGVWYLLRGSKEADLDAIIARLTELPEVEVAERDYVMRLVESEAPETKPNRSTTAATSGDPERVNQWALDVIEAPAAWQITRGAASQVIAIIDTGIDRNHVDLKDKLWMNPYELAGDANKDGCPGRCGTDDDGDGLIDEDGQGRQRGATGYDTSYAADDDENGFIDDFNGWNFIDQTNNPQDDNGHGTHCAGVAAATTDNGIGISGVCPLCRIMPIKAFERHGTASVSDIAKAVDYARRNGATIISMSFSSPVDSTLMSDALYAAYPTVTLVAAAGNSGESRVSALCEASGQQYVVRPSYPANYSFVIGVEASDKLGRIAPFSNCQYPVRVPGVEILSTLPNNRYAKWSGTSMAAPHVAGVAGLLRAYKSGDPAWNAGLIFGQLIKTGGNAKLALTLGPQPKLELDSWEVIDPVGSCAVCDGDGAPDAGERVKVAVTLRNVWANATAVQGTMTSTSTDVTIVNGSSSWGSIGSNMTDSNVDNAFVIDVAAGAANEIEIPLKISVKPSNGPDTLVTTILPRVQNGIQKGGLIEGAETWTADHVYLVTANLLVAQGATLTIQPGTNVRVMPGKSITIAGTLIARGTETARIVFKGQGGSWLGIAFQSGSAPATFDQTGNYTGGCAIEYARIENCNGNAAIAYDNTWIARTIFADNDSNFGAVSSSTTTTARLEQNLFTSNRFLTAAIGAGYATTILDNTIVGNQGDGIRAGGCWTVRDNSVFSNSGSEMRATYVVGPTCDFSSNYWGTTAAEKIDSELWDFRDDPSIGWIKVDPPRSTPSELAPPVIASLTFNPPPPVTTGLMNVSATFSRPMNTGGAPRMMFGPSRPPARPIALSQQWVGGVDVSGTSPGGSTTLPGAFTFVAPPTITGLTPVKGKAAGGTYVTITGTNLAGATVTIGGNAAAVAVNGPTSVTVTTPPHVAGTANVVVTTAGGSATAASAFTYE